MSCSLIADSNQPLTNTAEVVLVGDNGTVNPNGAIYVPIDSVVSPAVSPLSGYAFKRWDVSGNIEIIGSLTNPGSALRIKGDGTVTALFERERPVLTVVESAHGTISISPGSHSYPYDTMISLIANPDTGWQFSSWTGVASGSNLSIKVLMHVNKTVSATFVPIPGVAGVVYVRKEAAGFTPLNGSQIFGGFTGFESDTNRLWYNNFTTLTGNDYYHYVIDPFVGN